MSPSAFKYKLRRDDSEAVVRGTLTSNGATRSRGHVFRRLWAFLVDLVLVAVLTVVLALVLDSALGGRRVLSSGDALLNAAAVLGILLFPFAFVVVTEAWFRATPGKALLGLEVTDSAGRPIGLRRAWLRLMYRLSPVGMLGTAALLARRPAWHERWTDTIVRRRGEPLGSLEPERPWPRTVAPATAVDPLPAGTAAATHGSFVASGPSSAPSTPSASAVSAAAVSSPVAARSQSRPGEATEAMPAVAPAVAAPVVASLADAPVVAAPGVDAKRAGDAELEPEEVEAVSSTAMLLEAAASGAGLPATGPVDCRCAQLAQLRGDEAASYARGHLLTVRRWPDAGHFALICPSTRLAWAASEGWGADGEVTLARVPSLAAAGPSPKGT